MELATKKIKIRAGQNLDFFEKKSKILKNFKSFKNTKNAFWGKYPLTKISKKYETNLLHKLTKSQKCSGSDYFQNLGHCVATS